MKAFAIGLVLATVLGCGNTASNGSAATPNAATQRTTTTGATLGGAHQSSPSGERTQSGKGIRGAGDTTSIAAPESPTPPEPTFAVPRAPAPANTGDPCPNCPEHR